MYFHKLTSAAFRYMSCHVELQAMRRAVALSDSGILHVQKKSLATMLAWSKLNSTYYASIIPHASEIQSAPNRILENLPLLTKALMRSVGSQLCVGKKRWELKQNSSGGSTGEPAIFYQDAAYRRWNRAGKLLFDGWTGVSAGHRKAFLWAAPRDVCGLRGLNGRLRQRLWNRYTLDAYRMSVTNMRVYLDRLEADPPDQLQVYAESGYELARFALSEGRRLQGITAVLSSAGTLYPDMRRTMEEAFGAPVFNRYGSREVGDIACECAEHQGLHVNPVTHYVEVLRNDDSPSAPGELGRVVVTSLTNFAQPLIRYEIGDMARWEDSDCACGCKWPLLAEVSGRVTDHLKSLDGNMVYGGALRHLLFAMPYIRKYQWVQESLENIVLRVVFDVDASPIGKDWQRDVNWLERQVQEVLGGRVRLDVQVMEEIPPSASGKHLYVISNI